ncbi:S8 family serine peptidase [candidate division CSSED10-310 bacterium]|uniref:S8 family serine peptidase n=1 Tax=candidate division CSSED10-310 bacterium TaxID=2855610 RepID=A0ABV6YRL1_UNCC1
MTSKMRFIGAIFISLCILLSGFAFFTHSVFSQDEISVTAAIPPAIYWVFFNDKGLFDEGAYQTALARERLTLTPRVKWRRSKTMGDRIVDFKDLPVSVPYKMEIKRAGINIRHESRWLNAVSCGLTRAQIEKLAALDFIKAIKPIGLYRRQPFTDMIAQSHPTDDHYSSLKRFVLPYDYGYSLAQVAQINVTAAHYLGFSGLGVIVSMLDTGYRTTHQAIAGRTIIGEWDFINNDGVTMDESGDPPEQHRHGTATLSTLGGFAAGTLIGPAFNAAFLLAKTENTAYELPIEEDHWVAALEWAERNGADIVSSSLAYLFFDDGSGYSYDDLDGQTAVTTRAASSAAERGILVVNAMGNDGPAPKTLMAPADAFNILACGAVDANGYIADFSSRGPTADGRTKPEVVARGVQTHCASSNSDSEYFALNGTSLSTPLIAGAAALVLEAHPDWTPLQVRQALMQSGAAALEPGDTYGWGLIDVVAAIYQFPAGINPLDADFSERIDGLDLIMFSKAYGSSTNDELYDEQLDIGNDGEIGDLEIQLLQLYAGQVLDR